MCRAACIAAFAAALSWPLCGITAEPARPAGVAASRPAPVLDHSGKTRRGKASYYARSLAGNTMADGTAMDPESNTAASKTLPLGTTARVTNLRNGRSTVVEIRDRGPFVKGRIVDLSPKAARALGIGRSGVVPVEVAPISVPQPDGSVKPGAGAHEPASGRDPRIEQLGKDRDVVSGYGLTEAVAPMRTRSRPGAG
jgi:rare lipoprotein A